MSFGRFVTVTEFSPDRSIDLYSTSEPEDNVISGDSTVDELNYDSLHDVVDDADKMESINVDNELASETDHTHKTKEHTHHTTLLEPLTDDASDDEIDDDGPRLRTPHFEVGEESEESESEETALVQVEAKSR